MPHAPCSSPRSMAAARSCVPWYPGMILNFMPSTSFIASGKVCEFEPMPSLPTTVSFVKRSCVVSMGERCHTEQVSDSSLRLPIGVNFRLSNFASFSPSAATRKELDASTASAVPSRAARL